jgi:hypothetical protein
MRAGWAGGRGGGRTAGVATSMFCVSFVRTWLLLGSVVLCSDSGLTGHLLGQFFLTQCFVGKGEGGGALLGWPGGGKGAGVEGKGRAAPARVA